MLDCAVGYLGVCHQQTVEVVVVQDQDGAVRQFWIVILFDVLVHYHALPLPLVIDAPQW